MDFSYLKTLFENLNNSANEKDTLLTANAIDDIAMKVLRPYQRDCWNQIKKTEEYAANGEKAWHFKLGTGTGKTEIFKFIAPYLMAKSRDAENKEGLVFGLICHRLCLIEDLRTRIIPTIIAEPDLNNVLRYVSSKNPAGCGLNKKKIKFYIVNSGVYKTTDNSNHDEKEDRDNIIINKSKELNDCLKNAVHVKQFIDNNNFSALKEEIDNNRKNGIHSMFICLYQSVARYEKKLSALNFDFIIGDECHALNNMGADVFMGCAKFFETVKKSFFFSATPQYHPDDPNAGHNQICTKKINDEFLNIEE